MTARPATAYRRIERNRLYTSLLLVVFFVLLFPVFGFLSSCLAVWMALYLLPMGGDWRSLLAINIAAALILAALTAGRVIYVTRFLPAVVGAIAVPMWKGGAIRRRLENLSLGAGLPVPLLFVLPGAECNAFATGPDPERASVVLTEGLLNSLSGRELDGVIAHELSHIRNYDIRLNSLVAAIVRTVRLPAPIYWLLVFALPTILLSAGLMIEQWSSILDALHAAQTVGFGVSGWLVISYVCTVLVGEALILVWPGVARLIQSRISRRREYLADAEAVTITRDPTGLARALLKVSSGPADFGDGSAARPVSLAGIEHLCIVPPSAGALALIFPTHPSSENRIAALEQMGAMEPLLREEPADPGIREAAQRIISEVRPLIEMQPSIREAVSWGLFIGVVVQALLIGLRLYQYGADPSFWKDVRLLPMASPFGFAGTTAALVAMRLSGRFHWWPLVLMFAFGIYIPFVVAFTLLPDKVPWSVESVLLMGLIAATEPLAGAVLGALTRRSFFEMLRDCLRAARK